jgi:hypothetical protein
MTAEDGRLFGTYGTRGSRRGLSVSGESRVSGFEMGDNGGLIFDGRPGTDTVFGVSRGETVKGTGRQPRNAGQGRR